MIRSLAVVIALGTTLGMSGLAVAQPAYAPNAPTYYPYAAAPPPPAATVYPPAVYQVPYQDPHTGGGASRAYSYWGAQKSN